MSEETKFLTFEDAIEYAYSEAKRTRRKHTVFAEPALVDHIEYGKRTGKIRWLVTTGTPFWWSKTTFQKSYPEWRGNR